LASFPLTIGEENLSEKERLEKEYPSVTDITDAERIEVVKEIFSTVTPKYDFLNHLLSLRRDVAWRRFAVKKMRFPQTSRFLDLAAGTGDLAIDVACSYPRIQVAALDFVQEMIDLGRLKIEKRRLSDRIQFLRGDALDLPFLDSSFDVVGIAFGIRNIPDKVKALKEMNRVVVPGGQVMILEMTVPRSGLFRGLYSIYLNRVLPRIARIFSRNPAAYRYLGDSIMNFPAPEAFAAIIEEAGLRNVERHSLTFGTTYLHIAVKP
jgi:demethylmenaquinone methyltransferase / 2-methoxy-6-polyprenyl-1,4-benzoquinol methylase